MILITPDTIFLPSIKYNLAKQNEIRLNIYNENISKRVA